MAIVVPSPSNPRELQTPVTSTVDGVVVTIFNVLRLLVHDLGVYVLGKLFVIGNIEVEGNIQVMGGSGNANIITETDNGRWAFRTVGSSGDMNIVETGQNIPIVAQKGTPDDTLKLFASGDVGVGDVGTPVAEMHIGGSIAFVERSGNPSDPPEGVGILWLSDGGGSGADGDFMVTSTAGGVTSTRVVSVH